MKVRLELISKNQLRDYIRLAYEGDEEMRRIHILGESATLDEMTDYTWDQSTGDSEIAGTRFYRIMMTGGKPVGYTTLVLHPVRLLFTFGLNIKYRRKEILQGWMQAIEKHLGYSYLLTLRLSNTRAVDFFRKYGFNVKEDTENNQYVLWRLPQLSQQSASPSQ